MSIRGRGPHTLIVQPRKYERIQGAKMLVNDGPAVLVERCAVQSVREWSTSEEYLTHGVQLLSLRRVFAREWPGDSNAAVFFKGGEFEVVGDPQEMDISPKTSHWVVTIKWLGDADPPVIHDPDADPEPPDVPEGVPDGDG